MARGFYFDIPARQRNAKPAAGAKTLPSHEQPVWKPLADGWRPLYGSIHDLGVSIEWHDFDVSGPFAWSTSFHPDSLELCLNLSGKGVIHCCAGSARFEPLTAGFYAPGKGETCAWRHPGQRHRFITFEFSPRFLRAHLAASDGVLHPLVEQFVLGRQPRATLGPIRRLTTEHERWARELLQPPSAQGARDLWYSSKVLQIMAEFFFERPDADELFCDRQKRVARDRVDKVVEILRADLVQPPELDELGRKVGCSPFHLSRTFSREMGMTIPQYLRKIRMERAAELLRAGRHNVTEAAFEVGYSSLSHFSQAFCQVIGCCPGLYPLKTPARPA